eukprot:CAMPEP_0117680824 /NCGR_PEP_ID=MMETSP0804-20121206/18590_1 /TAXON_ID=1074897 /ORGANISM="Tetraselmis astigmatica, Strain CCMP880" /LENGTH=441 /DNA_ID=CAMNT_0005490411 /DNA_START=369 /DNA_END=1691 /DNA_ORIENTATION=-
MAWRDCVSVAVWPCVLLTIPSGGEAGAERLHHVGALEVVAQLPIVVAGADAADDRQLRAAVLIARYLLCCLHQQRPKALVLELLLVPCRDRHCSAVNVQLPDDGAASLKLRLPVRLPPCALPQPEQPHQDVLLWVLVRQEGLPPPVGCVLPPHQLHGIRLNLVVDVLDAALPGPDVPTVEPEAAHAGQRQLPEVALLHATGHQGHGDVALDAVDSYPRRDHCKHSGNQINQLLGRVVFVQPLLPQLVQAGAADDQGRVQLEAVCAELRVLKELPEALKVPLPPHVWKVWHHMHHEFEACILGKLEAALGRLDGVPAVGVTCHILVDALQAELQPGAAIAEHLREVRHEAVVRASLDGEADALGVALLAKADVAGGVAAQCIMEVPHEVVAVLGGQGHEGAAHEDELHLVDDVPKLAELIHPAAGLDVGVVPGPDGAHAGGL